MKRMILLLLAVCLVSCLFALPAAADEGDVVIMINDQKLECDAAPFIQNGRTMVGLRGVLEKIGAQVSWNGEERSVSITYQGQAGITKEMILVIDNPQVQIKENGNLKETAVLDTAPTVVNDRTYIPLRFAAEAVDCTVDYYEHEATNTGIVLLYTPDFQPATLTELLESSYQLTPIPELSDQAGVTYYEFNDDILQHMGQDRLEAFREKALNEYGSFHYDDITARFADGSEVSNSYTVTKYRETIQISIVSDPRVENNEEAYMTVTDGQLTIVGSPILKVVSQK